MSYDTTEMKGFKIVLIVCRPKSASRTEYSGTKIWVQRIHGTETTEKYLGELNTEYGVYKPNLQPLGDVYIIVQCGETDGVVNLITAEGKFISIPGYYYALNVEGFIYTKQAVNELLAFKYDLKKKIGTDLSHKNVFMNNLLFHEIDGAHWIK